MQSLGKDNFNLNIVLNKPSTPTVMAFTEVLDPHTS